MPHKPASLAFLLVAASLLRSGIAASPAGEASQVTVQWPNAVATSHSTATLQVVVNPPLRPGTAVHDQAFAALHDLGADVVRYVPWLPYPKLAVAELEPPTDHSTSWDFSVIDPMTLDFLNATQGHAVVLNFSTIPAWMFKTAKPVTYPADPNQVVWDYTQGTELKDPTAKQLGDYYGRLVAWYVQGGFDDENGVHHASGHQFKLPWWEVLNEPDIEHATTPQDYTRRYDAIVTAVRRVSPDTKFVGLALAFENKLDYFEYFLDRKNHQAGVPLDAVSFHFYAKPGEGAAAMNPDAWHFCEQADEFLKSARAIDAIRGRLSPSTQLHVNELGVIASDDATWHDRPVYWNAAGAMYAYLYAELSKIGIEVVGESQLVGYPTQYPSVSMVQWDDGRPNARFRVLELLKNNFGPGDVLVETHSPNPAVAAQAYRTKSGRKLLLVNKANAAVDLALPAELAGASVAVVDETTAGGPAKQTTLSTPRLTLAPFAVAVVSVPKE